MNLLAIDWNPPLGIDLGFFVIRYYSLMFVIAFALGFQIMKRIFIAENIPLEKLDKLLMWVVFATVIGARLGHVFFYDWPYYSQHLAEILLPFQFSPEFKFTGFTGLASHGAAIGIITALYFFSKKILKKPLLYILDRVSLTIASGGVFVRLGNLMNSEIIGKPTGTDSGFIFHYLGEDFARYPTQLYESFGYLVVFLIIFYMFWKTQAKEKLGLIFGVFFTLLWSVRFFVEFFKEAQIDSRADLVLNTGQILSIPLIIIGIYFIISAKKQKGVS